MELDLTVVLGMRLFLFKLLNMQTTKMKGCDVIHSLTKILKLGDIMAT